MKIKLLVKTIVLLLVISSQVFAQQIKENEIVVIKGEKYILHQIRTGETIFSITQNYKVGSATLIENNPEIDNGLKIGEIIKIPYQEGVELNIQQNSQKGDPVKFEQYILTSRKETPYFIAKNFNLTVEELYAYNPEVRRFKKGTQLRIPIWNVQQQAEVAGKVTDNQQQNGKNDLIMHEVQAGETLFSIAKKYKISESEILFYNPGAQNLQAGTKLYLPANNVVLDEMETTQLPENGIEPSEKQNENFFEHIIESGQTLWGTARKYGVSEKQILDLNPMLQAGFQTGLVIKIPVKELVETKVKPVNDAAFEKHFVEKGETLYGLGAQYNLSISEIKKYNPVLEKRNLIFGETILIPRKPNVEIVQFMQNKNEADSIEFTQKFYEIEVPVEIPESCNPLSQNQVSHYKKYDVALFLPLFLQANNTLNKKRELLVDSLNLLEQQTTEIFEIDTLIEKEQAEDLFVGFYSDTENYIEFYEGVLLAVDSMLKAGMNVRLHVFDTQRSADSIRKFIYSPEFLNIDLIIGPIFENVQKEVAELAFKNQIPLISPLVSRSGIVQGNPYFYQVNPSREYLATQTAELVADEYNNSNFIVLKTRDYENTTEGRIVDMIREKLFNSGYFGHSKGSSFTLYDFENEGPFGLRRILSKRKENVVFIPSLDEGELSLAISNIDNLAGDYPITLIGTNRYSSYESIEIKHFHDLKLEYISPYWVDYENPKTLNYIEKFKSYFNSEPSNFGMQGFDVSFYFLNALFTYGKDFSACLPYLQPDLLQGTYQFEKVSEFGGFMNEGVSVVKYNRKYEVGRTRIKGRYYIVKK